ncbi:MAG TPA: hydrogenase expression/formation protein HypE [Candidatus Bipolaricaulota bacterium]|nr:hydrogenase expression/formation protein HypE [Candidatus Bipolaricaulota bacterium]
MIDLDHGGGGFKNNELIRELRKIINLKTNWTNTEDDAAIFDLGDKKLVFTTDAFIVDPIFFPGGDIGKIAACGTINDLAVMGAKPLGLSLSIVLEEGFSKKDLFKIAESIDKISKLTNIPIVTGDTKVMEKGKIDKIEITTAGVGLVERVIDNGGAKAGDNIITSGDLGEHGLTLLAYRFDYQTDLISDCRPLLAEFQAVGHLLNAAKDPTRGGVAANMNEIAAKSKIKIVLDEDKLPYKKEVFALTELLGIELFTLPSEGRFIAAVSPQNTDEALKKLQEFNPEAKIIGKCFEGEGVFLKTKLGSERQIEEPRGKLIPRIC